MAERGFPMPVEAQVERIEQKMKRPGMVFGEPLREGANTIIPVVISVTKGEASVTRPVAVIVMSGETVKLHRLGPNPAAQVLIAFALSGMIGACAALLFPPWRPGESLLGEVGKLIRTIRDGDGGGCCLETVQET